MMQVNRSGADHSLGGRPLGNPTYASLPSPMEEKWDINKLMGMESYGLSNVFPRLVDQVIPVNSSLHKMPFQFKNGLGFSG